MKNQNSDVMPASETIRRIKEKNRTLQEPITPYTAQPYTTSPGVQSIKRQRVSKKAKPISTPERQSAMNDIIRHLLLGEITQGKALKMLRADVLGLKQDAFATLVSISRKTLSDVENDRGNYTADVINKLFNPFGLQVGLVPTSRHRLAALLASEKSDA
ncbi:helix-turn-helix transcriptional regulator [Candidatus Symbiopectobacterium sp. NZEC151]|uniref:helix-turn-helix transcriptional regulator n=2 Tax=unclassified Symbiopectobacterium TaxID=2794573 RepID=UPI0022275080|nr:helix-turn-helix transcriptional regulator [Candidatus Symbiopectobacterium sp. NZEC151]MCW2475432.1 helix-turn-helix transcriptional regulator [Candidatus Symbiopectobacterium sp. NZEC151]